jgi:hypothetical protein
MRRFIKARMFSPLFSDRRLNRRFGVRRWWPHGIVSRIPDRQPGRIIRHECLRHGDQHEVRSDWNVHALEFSAKGDTRRDVSQANENVTGFAVRGDGRLDILRDIYALGGAGYQLLHDDRSSPDSVNGKKPVEYHVTSANLGYVHELGRLGARADATIDSFSFNNATASTGATINQRDRDRIVYTVAPRLTYEIVPAYNAFAKLSGNDASRCVSARSASRYALEKIWHE